MTNTIPSSHSITFTKPKSTLSEGDRDETFSGRATYDLAYFCICLAGNPMLNYGEPIVMSRSVENPDRSNTTYRTTYTL